MYCTATAYTVSSQSRNFYSHSCPAPAVVSLMSAVFTVWVPVLAIPICFSILPVTECHDVESGMVSKPIAATTLQQFHRSGSTFYSQSRGITTVVTLAHGGPKGQKAAVGPQSHGTPVGLLLLALQCKTLVWI